jgi:hypothetical protein
VFFDDRYFPPECLDHTQGTVDGQCSFLLFVVELLHGFLSQLFRLVRIEAAPGIPAGQVLNAQDILSPLFNQMRPLPQQVPHGSLGSRIDKSFLKLLAPQQLRQSPGVRHIIGVFDSTVLLDGRWICQMHPVSCVPEPIHQPIPVVR